MRQVSRASAAMGVALATLLGTSACFATFSSTTSESTVDTGGQQETNADALHSYVKREQAGTTQVMEQSPGVYSRIDVTGSREDISGDQGIPAGTYSVVWFDYYYANPVDQSSVIEVLESQVSQLEEGCDDFIFPEMSAAGVIGPMGAVFSYDDGTGDGPFWSYACSTE